MTRDVTQMLNVSWVPATRGNPALIYLLEENPGQGIITELETKAAADQMVRRNLAYRGTRNSNLYALGLDMMDQTIANYQASAAAWKRHTLWQALKSACDPHYRIKIELVETKFGFQFSIGLPGYNRKPGKAMQQNLLEVIKQLQEKKYVFHGYGRVNQYGLCGFEHYVLVSAPDIL